MSESGRENSVSIVWKTKVVFNAASDGITTTLPVRILTPFDQHASTTYSAPSNDPDYTYTWQLRVKVRRFGLRHTLTFEIPVRAADGTGNDESEIRN
jgi:hypothetical protein